ncbi:uncharacterized protein F5891DRAFT_960753, partial [Suillus fuscotomentosus]
VHSYGDWSIASELWIDALSFIMPWKELELRDYNRYLTGIFTDIHYSVHSYIINFDQACQLKVKGKKYLHFNDFHEFKQLETSHLSSLGMVVFTELQCPSGLPSSSDKGSGKSLNAGQKLAHTDSSSQREPCHNWN